jgi:methyl-accepting chemotaxis protein
MARVVDRFRAAALEKVEMERDAAQMRASADAERQNADAERAAAAEAMSGVVSTLAGALGKLADGDLTYRVRDGFPYEYDSLKTDLNRAFESLQDALGRITQNAESVRSASSAIAGAAEDLSSRTESQAASLEQSAAAIDEITATTRKTADGAAHARQVVARARGEAEAGGAVVRDAVQAMSEIENSSEKIGQIIGVIDEIAFQTNLLALNAGVEAARAGEAGRGFAVVASEVRALAQRSADAAKQIKDLILSSKAQVERGVELVDGAGSALERIISGVAEIDGAVSEIAISAQEQATGLVEVSTAVGQMDQFTQQNAAMVEQVTAQVRELSRQASEFADLVGGFRTGVTIRPAAAPKPAAPVKSAAPKLAAVRPAAKPVALKPAALAAPRTAAAKAAPAASALAAAPVSDGGWEEF